MNNEHWGDGKNLHGYYYSLVSVKLGTEQGNNLME